MSVFAKHAIRVVLVVLLGGILGATLIRFAPGFGVDEAELDTRLNHESIEAMRHARTNDGVVSFYVSYFGRLFRGDLGMSQTLQRPVAELLRERLPETMKAVGLGLAFGWVLGFSMAVAVVTWRVWYFDLAAGILAGVVLCLPAAVMALAFLLLQAPARLVIGLVIFPKVFRYSRNLLARSAAAPHIITARAKGAGEARVLFWHVLPATAPQLLALAAVSVSVAFTAAIPMEALCDLPGIGQLAWKAALGRDIALLIDITMIVALITVLANSVSDFAGHAFQRTDA